MARSPKFKHYRFNVTQPGFQPDILKALVHMALKETELIYGRAKVKLDVTYKLSSTKPICTIEANTECGEHLAKLLSGFLIKQVGEQNFRVMRLMNQPKEF